VTTIEGPAGVWAPSRRRLTVGLVFTVTLVAFESLSVATVLPAVGRDLGDVRLYGWVFSAFFLGSLVGIVIAGQQADRHGLVRPFGFGLILFGVGLIIGGSAPAMPVLVVARAIQGLGAGAIPAAAYVAIGRGYPSRLRPRMFAVLSTAWVVPGLVGPALAGLIADHLGWRWVFLGLLPLVVGCSVLILPAVRGFAPADPEAPARPEAHREADPEAHREADPEADRERPADYTEDAGVPANRSRLFPAVRVALGAGLLLAGLTVASLGLTPVLIAAGLLVAIPAFITLVPPGTLAARPGLPAAVLSRGVLTFAFFAGDAYVPLTLTSIRGTSAAIAGLALTASTLTWTLGAWIQERRIATWGPRRLITMGFVLVAIGTVGMTSLLSYATPIWVGPVMWAVAGLGIGLAYAPISVTVLHDAPPGQEGRASSALSLTDVLGTALGTGTGGAAVALGHANGWDPRAGLAVAFAIAAIVAGSGTLVARRVRDSLPT
jgi:MFS family permease